ncbi:MAG: glutathione S-transferase [Cyanobacteria bacterium J06555_13]
MKKLLGRKSSINVRKVLWTLHELGVSIEREDWGEGFRPTTAPEFLKLNPNGLVPVYVEDDLVLWESNTICRYLVAKHQRYDLLPKEVQSRAAVEQWIDWSATNLNAAWRYSFMALVRKAPGYEDPTEIASSISSWNRHMEILDRQILRTQAYLTGDRFTLADIIVGLCINRWIMSPIEHANCPAVLLYYEEMKQRDGFMMNGAGNEP